MLTSCNFCAIKDNCALPFAMERIKHYYIPLIVNGCEDLTSEDAIPGSVKYAVETLKEYIDANYKRPEGQYSKIRKMIYDGIAHPATMHFVAATIKMSKNQYDLVNRALSKVVQMKNANQTVLAYTFILAAVNKVRPCITFPEKFIFLQLACGARKIELLDEGTSLFKAIPNQRRLIKQFGFAKKGDASDIKEVTKPLLWIDSWDFLALLEEVREEVRARGKIGRNAIAKSFATQLECFCASLWPQNGANGYRTGTHLNRAIYANVAYHFRKRPGESLTHFIKHQLGHCSMGAAANYMNVSIAFEGDVLLRDEASRQELPFSDGGEIFVGEDGKQVLIEVPPIQKMTEEQRIEQVLYFAERLRAHNVRVSRGNLMRLGLQSGIIRDSGVLE